MAFLAPENLTGDPAFDWASAAAAPLAASLLRGAPSVSGFAAADANDALRRQATRIVRTYFARDGQGWAVRGSVEDAAHPRTVAAIDASIAGPEAAAAAMARAVWPAAAAPGWKPDAVRAFGEALAAGAGSPAEALRRAVALEPSFEEAWLRLGRLEQSRAGREAALAAIEGAPKTPQLRLFAAGLSQDPAARIAALKDAAAASPGDWEAQAQLAGALTRDRKFAEAAAAFDKALQANSDSGALRNEAAFAYELAGRHDLAVKTALDYAKLSPDSANPLDTLGEIQSMAGKFAEAEKAFLEAHAKQPGFLGGAALWKAAAVRRMSGDGKGADALFDRYEAAIAGNPAAPMLRAQWDYSSGRRDEAEKKVREMDKPGAKAQLAIWSLNRGDREAAARYAAEAGETSLARGLVTGGAPNPFVRACHHLFARRFAEAIPLLEQADAANRPDQSSPLPVLLAWAYAETGRLEEARQRLRHWPIPASAGDAALECLTFPRVLELRKRLGM